MPSYPDLLSLTITVRKRPVFSAITHAIITKLLAAPSARLVARALG